MTVAKGQPFPDGHPLVRLDRDAADAAAKDGRSRTPLFAPMDTGEEEAPPVEKAAPKAAARGKGA